MSEQELLMLSNYVYMDASTDPLTIGQSLERFKNADGGFDAASVAAAGVGGGMSAEQAADLFTRMDAMDEDFLALYPARYVDDPDLRGVCFVTNAAADSGTVVFRGTGGSYNAWHDNVTGEYLPDTAIQQRAADFVNYDCAGYSDLTVTGHSKGGNLAMYTTVMCATVTGCVSFDGQGFSLAFLKEYASEILASKDRIKSVSAYNDFVNILLRSIAGERVFARNTGDGIDAHSSYYLLVSNEFDENGNLITVRHQSPLAWALEETLGRFTDSIDLLPGEGNKQISDLLAAYVAAGMSADMGEEYEKKRIAEAADDVGDYLLSFLPDAESPVDVLTRITTKEKEAETDSMKSAASRLLEVQGRIRSVTDGILALDGQILPGSRIGFYVQRQLASMADRLQEEERNLGIYGETLQEITGLYLTRELELAGDIAS